MRPPAEQLIRDYLNRLSVAARTRLQSDDRRAFLARTREHIERQSGGRDTADPATVLRALNDLGEPEAVVEREHAIWPAVPHGDFRGLDPKFVDKAAAVGKRGNAVDIANLPLWQFHSMHGEAQPPGRVKVRSAGYADSDHQQCLAHIRTVWPNTVA